MLLFFSDSLAMSMLATVHNAHIVTPPRSFTLALDFPSAFLKGLGKEGQRQNFSVLSNTMQFHPFSVSFIVLNPDIGDSGLLSCTPVAPLCLSHCLPGSCQPGSCQGITSVGTFSMQIPPTPWPSDFGSLLEGYEMSQEVILKIHSWP